MKTTIHELKLTVETRQHVDAPTSIGAVRIGGSPVPLPPEVMTTELRFAIAQALIFAGKYDDGDEPNAAIADEIARTIG